MKAKFNKENQTITLENQSVYNAIPGEANFDFIQRVKKEVSMDFKTDLEIIYTPSSNDDELNPDYIFSLTSTEILCAIANGLIDPVSYAKYTLTSRGLDYDGNWVGFEVKCENNLS
jgi:hypothetical protein